MDVVVRGALIVTSGGLRAADVGVEKGRIAAVGAVGADARSEIIAGRGWILLPGGVDPHVHMEQLTASGQVSSDDFESGSLAALHGGITAVGDFAYPEEGERLADALRRRREAARERCLCGCFFHVAVSGSPPDLERQMDECCADGVISFKVHMNDVRADAEMLERICRACAERDCILMVHAEDGAWMAGEQERLVREGKTGLEFFPGSRPPRCEAAAIERVASMALLHGTALYIVHLTSGSGLDVIRRYRERGGEVYAETCPHYLLLTEEKYGEKDGYCFTCCPPFRKDGDRLALWEGLADGSIDTIATDHCPFTREQKDSWGGDFTRIPFGIPGVETMIPLFFSEGRKRGFTYERLSALVTGNASRIFRLSTPRGDIRVGDAADLFLYDPCFERVLEPSSLHMNCGFSPYEGMSVNGYPVLTVRGGKIWRNR